MRIQKLDTTHEQVPHDNRPQHSHDTHTHPIPMEGCEGHVRLVPMALRGASLENKSQSPMHQRRATNTVRPVVPQT